MARYKVHARDHRRTFVATMCGLMGFYSYDEIRELHYGFVRQLPLISGLDGEDREVSCEKCLLEMVLDGERRLRG